MKTFSVILFLLVFVSCQQEELEPSAYMRWLRNEDNGLLVSKQVGKQTFHLQYKTCEYEALLHASSTDPAKTELDEAIAPIRTLQYYTFTIESPEKKDPAASEAVDEADYNQRLNYLMFDMQQDFSLVDGTDTVDCLFYHYERNYNLSSENKILLGFEAKQDKGQASDKTLIYDDKLLGCGPVLITIKASAIQSIPNLKLSH